MKTGERPIAFSVRLSAKELEMLRTKASRAGVTVTDLVRSAVAGTVQASSTVTLGNATSSTTSARAVVSAVKSPSGAWQVPSDNRTEAA